MACLNYARGAAAQLGYCCSNVPLPARLNLVDRDAKVDERKMPGDLFVCATCGNQAIDVIQHLAVSFSTLLRRLGRERVPERKSQAQRRCRTRTGWKPHRLQLRHGLSV